MTRKRFERLTIVLAGLVLSYGLLAYQAIKSVTGLSPALSAVLTILTSTGLFKLMLSSCYWAVSKFGPLTSLYLGPERYWRGYWHYTSKNNETVHLGIWRVKQDVRGTSILACGLDKNYKRRFEANSVTDPLEREENLFEVIYAFESNDDGGRQAFAKTRVAADPPQGSFFRGKGPHFLRGKTFNYGGKMNDFEFTDVKYVRHPDVQSEDELIEKLRREGIVHGEPT